MGMYAVAVGVLLFSITKTTIIMARHSLGHLLKQGKGHSFNLFLHCGSTLTRINGVTLFTYLKLTPHLDRVEKCEQRTKSRGWEARVGREELSWTMPPSPHQLFFSNDSLCW